MKVAKPDITEYASFYSGYIDLVDDPHSMLEHQLDQLSDYIQNQSARLDYKYATEKWSIKEVILHICDTEVIFLYRLLRILRNDNKDLAGFDENEFISKNNFDHMSSYELISYWENTRILTFTILNQITEQDLDKSGKANNSNISLRAIIFIIAGHCAHHLAILNDRYEVD